jgi:hypothetical protein
MDVARLQRMRQKLEEYRAQERANRKRHERCDP